MKLKGNWFNQFLALESLKDQLEFLVTILLGDDFLIHKTKIPKLIPTFEKNHRDIELSWGCDKSHEISYAPNIFGRNVHFESARSAEEPVLCIDFVIPVNNTRNFNVNINIYLSQHVGAYYIISRA
jgi:hypothetical protein